MSVIGIIIKMFISKPPRRAVIVDGMICEKKIIQRPMK